MKKSVAFICILGLVYLLYLSFFSDEKKDNWVVPLEKVQPRWLEQPEYGEGLVKFSPDSKFLVAASEEGKVRVWAMDRRKLIWCKSLGIGSISTVAFSLDSQYLFLGEKSPEARIYCFSLRTKKLCWSYLVADDLKNNLAKKSYPSINRIVLDDKKGILYMAAGRFEKVNRIDYAYASRIYALQPQTGELFWKFPQERNMDVNCRYLDVDKQGERLVFNTTGGSRQKKAQYYPAGSIYCLDLTTQKIVWSQRIKNLEPYFWRTAFSESPSFSADGRKIALMTNDGRLYLFDREGRELWQREITTPKKAMDGIPLYAPGTFAEFWQDQVIVRTANTYNAGKSGGVVPLEHPNANSILSYNMQGDLLWKWQANGYMPQQELSGNFLLLPVEKNFRTQDLAVQGAYLLQLTAGQPELVHRYKLPDQGAVIAASRAPNGAYVAVMEAPLLMANGLERKGKSQLHIWQTR